MEGKTVAVECVLYMDRCLPDRLTANKVMLCARNIFMLENNRDINPDEFKEIIRGSGNAGIVKL